MGSISNELQHFARVVYFSFDSWDDAHDFWKAMVGKHCTRAKVREAERFTTRFEVKLWGLSEATLEKLVNRARARLKPKKNLPLPPLSKEWEKIRGYDSIRAEAA